MRTSKLILFTDYAIAILLLVIVVIGAYLEKDMSPVTAVAAGWDAKVALSTGFYYWKAKNENRSKYAMKLVRELARDYGIENVVDLANTVLKD